MKIKNRENFQSAIDEQLASRKKELAVLRLLYINEDFRESKKIINRLIIPHVYSHFEGFIKQASIIFLNYIISIYDISNELPENIFAIHMRENIKKLAESNKCEDHVVLINMIKTKPEKLKFRPEIIIDTQSNLSSKVLKEIMYQCGIPFDAYWQGKIKFIDGILLESRNPIAHGELRPIDDEAVDQCISNVIEILDKYKLLLEGKS